MKGENGMAGTKLIAEPGRKEIIVTRVFDAPPELVFQAMTDPSLVPQWWGPRCLTTVVDQMEVRPGGLWRFINRELDGYEYAFHGVYHRVAPSEQLVYTVEFEGMPGHVLLETITFEELEGKTKITDQSVFQSVDDRDGMLNSGLEGGVLETLDRLAELLAERLETMPVEAIHNY
jgi:uncharacterized protein YndB with AHSA1/START domain